MATFDDMPLSEARKFLTKLYSVQQLRAILADPVATLAAQNLIAHRSDRICDWFSGMVLGDFKITSDIDPSYNCIAWAAGTVNAFWWPRDGYWPPGVRQQVDTTSFVEAFRAVGFERCNDGMLEEGFEKIAIFEKNGKPTHAARQLSTGEWSSKLGRWEDI